MRKLISLFAFCAALTSCKISEDTSATPHSINPMTTSKLFDPHSASTSDARVSHLHWTANVNVETHIISANATFDFVAEKAKSENLKAVHLDSGHQRFIAHRLYLNKGMKIVSHHFKIEL